jgi:phosphatidylglycerophosphate synthase
MEESHYSREFIKKYFLNFLEKKKIKPSTLVIIRFIFAFLTAGIIFYGSFILSIIFLTIYQFVFLLDYLDGPLARKRKEFSIKWSRADRIGHSIVTALFLSGVVFRFYLNGGGEKIIILGGLGITTILLSQLIEIWWINQKGMDFGKLKKIYQVKGKFFLIYNFLRIDGFLTLFFFLYIFNYHKILILFFSFMYMIIFIKKIRSFIKWKIQKK